MPQFKDVTPPADGQTITISGGRLNVPDRPIIPFIEGDGTGPDIWRASVRVFDAAVQKAYGGRRKIAWMEVYAGEKSFKQFNNWLPDDTVAAFQHYLVGIKGPLTTPVGGGIRSLNVALRQMLDLYVCLRPVRYFKGVPSPVKTPEKVDMVIFRENTEDIYAGIEYAGGTPESQKVLDFLQQNFPKEFKKVRFGTKDAARGWLAALEGIGAPHREAGIEYAAGTPEAQKILDFFAKEFPKEFKKIRFGTATASQGWQQQLEGIGSPKRDVGVQVGVGLKPISYLGTERLAHSAISYAIATKRKSVTFVHKGNIMKFTEGAFMKWGYALAEKEFGDHVYTWGQWERTKEAKSEDAANAEQKAALASGRILIKDAIADITLQQVLTRPEEFDVIATLNLNGDYLSDALAAQVGGIGIAPGGNINYLTGHAVFEATHGTAPKYADLDKVNPGSVILSGEMMLRYMGWTEAADALIRAMDTAIGNKLVTYDFARLMEGAKEVKCSEFADELIKAI